MLMLLHDPPLPSANMLSITRLGMARSDLHLLLISHLTNDYHNIKRKFCSQISYFPSNSRIPQVQAMPHISRVQSASQVPRPVCPKSQPGPMPPCPNQIPRPLVPARSNAPLSQPCPLCPRPSPVRD